MSPTLATDEKLPAGRHQVDTRPFPTRPAWRRALVGTLLIVVAVAGWAAPAFGHAELQSTTPGADAVLSRSPGTIVCHFDEAVEVQFGSVRVFDSNANRVDSGQASHPHGDGRAVATNVPGNLPAGGYVVTWRVISDDGHPVHGAFTFSIGKLGAAATSSTKAEAARLLSTGGGSHAVGVLFGVVRWLAFLGLAVLVGGAAFLSVAWREGTRGRRIRTLLWGSWAVALLSTAIGLGLQGPYGGGLSLVDAFKPTVINAVLHTRFGEVYLARLVILLVALPLLAMLAGRRPLPRWWRPAGALVGLALLVTPGLSGHAAAGSLVALAIPFDLVHLSGVSVWVGGLAVLAVGVLPAAGRDDRYRVVTRFSQWALAAVVAIAISGGFAAWRQVGSLSNVTTTPYGRLVLYKTIGFAVLVGVASMSRRLVHGDLALPLVGRTRQSPVRPAGVLSPGPGAAPRRPQSASQLRRAVFAELGVLAVVLAFSAVLVNAPPARAAVSKPYAAEVRAGNRVLVDVVVEPAKAGPLTVHLYTLDPSGAQFDAAGVDASLNLPAKQIEGLKVPLEKAGPGHWTTTAFDVPIRGHWTMQVTVQLGSASDVVVAPPITVPIR